MQKKSLLIKKKNLLNYNDCINNKFIWQFNVCNTQKNVIKTIKQLIQKKKKIHFYILFTEVVIQAV